jgi:hypothetical protein
MNTITTNPSAASTIAHHAIAERVRDAEQRRIARTARDERRAAARTAPQTPGAHDLPWWAFSFLRPAH